jgi:predicted flap endonuclease-1-like 5' DNA nuclease
LDDGDFERILRLTTLQRATVDFAAIRADARRLAEATGTMGLTWDGETPNDFEPIQGIGTVFEQRLYDAGIRTYRALAAATPAELAAICQARPPLAPDYESWIQQAQQLLDVT